jgi:hypothetical protein
MKNHSLLLAMIALLASLLSTTNAATQIYDLKTDWSDTQNPNGTWTYCLYPGGPPLPNDPIPWAWVYYDGYMEAITATTADAVVSGYREVGDIYALHAFEGSPVCVRWTAPGNGTISVSGAIWHAAPDGFSFGQWTLALNGNSLSVGYWNDLPRSAPNVLSTGSTGPNGLLNIPVQAGDQVELSFVDYHFSDQTPFGIDFTVTFTSDTVDPVAAIESLAITVINMNLQNGIENSLDSKLDAALNALLDVNVSNDGAACNSLAAFINAVEAQRGNKITSAQADQLIASAQQIQSLLNCGN